jgi:hypothetical protein
MDIPRIYHVYTSSDIPCIYKDIPCISSMHIHGISLDTMYIHVIGYTMYIHGYTMYIPDILVTFQYVRDIHGIYQVYTENRGSRYGHCVTSTSV